MHDDATDDPLRSMAVDRVVRDDGRYLIYYLWPDADAPEREATRTAPDAAVAESSVADV
jgi:hypothetical protein